MTLDGGQTTKEEMELILREIESLPTLSSVAVRVLELSGRDDAEVQEIARLVESDPALSARVLSMCRRADRVTANDVISVERAVVLLGMEAVRAALLSVELFGVISEHGEAVGESSFDREGFWRHCLGVAVAAERIATTHREELGIKPGAAFVAGLVHDLGKLALHWVLPKAYERVLVASWGSRVDLATIERRALGIDHYVAGKRLAEHWHLPHALQDVLWLHGQPERAVPDLAHRALVGLVGVADAVVRSLHVGWSGEANDVISVEDLCASWSLDAARVREAGEHVHEMVSERAGLLGLGDQPGEKLLLESIGEANQRLGAMARTLERRSRDRSRMKRALGAVDSFAARANRVSGIEGACGAVLESAAGLAGEEGVFALFWRARNGQDWRMFWSGGGEGIEEAILGSQPSGEASGLGGRSSGEVTLGETGFMPWARDRVREVCGVSEGVSLVPVMRGKGASAVLVHDRGALGARVGDEVLAMLAGVWGLALSGAGRHEGAKGVSELLVEANMQLAAAQDELVESRSMAMLGRMTAGAAHEMNNPLMVISGNAQKLRRLVRGDEAMDTTKKVIDASENLSELISALHLLSSPPEPVFSALRIERMIEGAVSVAIARLGEAIHDNVHERLVVEVQDGLPEVWVDEGQVRQVIAELVLNGLESSEDAMVRVLARFGAADDRLEVVVTDTGPGMSRETLEHACDPFYSRREAGRGVGLGLARSRRFAEMNECGWKLDSEVGVGTSALISIPLVSGTDAAAGRAA